jgi:hypothetical protein
MYPQIEWAKEYLLWQMRVCAEKPGNLQQHIYVKKLCVTNFMV